MNIPSTVAGLLVVLLAVLPGVPGDALYRTIAGVSWKEKDLRYVLRLLLFSVLGLVLYSLTASVLDWYQPVYVDPTIFTGSRFDVATLPRLGVAYIGHFVGASTVGALTAAGRQTLSPHRDAWDQFMKTIVGHHWIVVSLTAGEQYVGYVRHGDMSVEPEYRDLILGEPYWFNSETGSCEPTYQQDLFIRGSDIVSVATVHDPEKDHRVVPVSESPFS